MRTDVIAAVFSAMTDVASGGAWVTAASGAGELGGGVDGAGADDAGTEGDGEVCRSGWLVHAASDAAASTRLMPTQKRRRHRTVESDTRTH
jgi:hypothetical protein